MPVRLTFEGPPDRIEGLVTYLQDLGCEVAYVPPPVHPDIIVEEVRVIMHVAHAASTTTITEIQTIDTLVGQFSRRLQRVRIMIELEQ